MSKVVVTGGAGFIGSHVVDALLAAGHDVHVVDDFSTGKRENTNAQAQYYEHDVVVAYEDLLKVCEDASVVFHLAASISVPYSLEHPHETSRNIQATVNTLQAARERGVSRVLFVSSAAVYGDQKVPVAEDVYCNPVSPYGLEKLVGEQYCRLFSHVYGLSTVVTRIFNAYGPRQTNQDGALIPTLFAQQQAGTASVLYGSGEQTRDFVYVDDIVSALLQLAFSEKSFQGDIFNVASGEGTPIRDVFECITDSFEKKPARLEITDSIADIHKIQEAVGWVPRMSVTEGIQKVKNSYAI